MNPDNTSIINVKENIPFDVSRGALLNIISSNVTPYTHGFHKYPAKFIPQIPRWAIDKYLSDSLQKTILDPFCGSGTTMVETLIAGHNGIGIDIDPLSILISKVKTTKLHNHYLLTIVEWLKRNMFKVSEGSFLPVCPTIDHWFSDDAITKLSIIRSLIDNIPIEFGASQEIKDIQDLFIICLSSIIRGVSNADDQSQKTYVSHTRSKIPREVFRAFIDQLDYFVERISLFSSIVNPNTEVNLLNISSLNNLEKLLNDKNIDLVVTSPPYIKAIDYIYNQMVELFWIGDLFSMQTQSKQNEKKKLYVGNKQIPKSDYADFSPSNRLTGITELDNSIQSIFDSDNKNGLKHSFITFKYFEDMDFHFSDISNILRSGTHYVMVIGNSTVSNIQINASDFLIDIAERNGFRLSMYWSYIIKNHFMRFDRNGRGGKIDQDHVLDFVKV